MLSAVLSDVAKSAGACRHALPKFPGETVERFRRHAQGFQACEGERDACPSVARSTGWFGGRGYDIGQPPHQLAPALTIINAKQKVSCGIRSWSRPEHPALNVVELKFGGCYAGHSLDSIPPSRAASLRPGPGRDPPPLRQLAKRDDEDRACLRNLLALYFESHRRWYDYVRAVSGNGGMQRFAQRDEVI